MINNILEMCCISEMYNIINADKGGVWHIYEKEIDDNQIVVTFCKYINGIAAIQAQAVIFIDDWEVNKYQFDKLCYISEI